MCKLPVEIRVIVPSYHIIVLLGTKLALVFVGTQILQEKALSNIPLSSLKPLLYLHRIMGTKTASNNMNIPPCQGHNKSSSSSSSTGDDDQVIMPNRLPPPLQLQLPFDLTTLLALPSHNFLAAALSLKNQVVEATWGGGDGCLSSDPTLYTGLLGTAFTCLRSYDVTADPLDLDLCSRIVDACAAAPAPSLRGGIYAIGAVVANYKGDQHKRDFFLNMFLKTAQELALPIGPQEGGFGMSYELMYGRAGFLWAALFIDKHLGEGTLPFYLVRPVVDAVLAGGRAGAPDNTACPLMYRWHGTRYWGAASGLAGILHVLLHFPLSKQDAEDVKATLRYMMSKRFPHSGNYPSSEGNPRDTFVQWSHGATGMAITLRKASQVFPEEKDFRDAAIEAGEVVWKSGAEGKKAGLADGVAGNAYAFLSLYRLTGDRVYEERAKAFAGYLYHNVTSTSNSGSNEVIGFLNDDGSWSLFQGLAGIACLWFDVFAPQNARFPGYEL